MVKYQDQFEQPAEQSIWVEVKTILQRLLREKKLDRCDYERINKLLLSINSAQEVRKLNYHILLTSIRGFDEILIKENLKKKPYDMLIRHYLYILNTYITDLNKKILLLNKREGDSFSTQIIGELKFSGDSLLVYVVFFYFYGFKGVDRAVGINFNFLISLAIEIAMEELEKLSIFPIILQHPTEGALDVSAILNDNFQDINGAQFRNSLSNLHQKIKQRLQSIPGWTDAHACERAIDRFRIVFSYGAWDGKNSNVYNIGHCKPFIIAKNIARIYDKMPENKDINILFSPSAYYHCLNNIDDLKPVHFKIHDLTELNIEQDDYNMTYEIE